MRLTLNRREVVQFVCDSSKCRKEEVFVFEEGHPTVPTGWIALNAPDSYVQIEGKSLCVDIQLECCTQLCLYRALEDKIDEALDKDQ